MYTSVEYTNVSSVGPYALGFKYLKKDYISASYVDPLGIAPPVSAAFTWEGTVSDDTPFGTAIRLVDTPPGGRNLVIAKNVSLTILEVLWMKGAALTKTNLHRMSMDLLDKIQTVADDMARVEALALEVLENIELILPENIEALAVEIRGYAERAEAAAGEAAEQAASLQYTVDLDFGAGARYKKFIIPVSFPRDIPAFTNVRLTQLGQAPGRAEDENEWDYIVCNVVVNQLNELTVHAKSLDGSAHGIYRFALTF